MERRHRIEACQKATFAIAVVLMGTLLASLATGQRARVFGRAFRLDGSAWTNASVTLTARPIPEYWHVGKPDTVRVRTDERGRFEAMLLDFRAYSGWAHSALPDGGYRMSKIAEDIVPGRPVKLDERPDPQIPFRFRVELPDGVAGAAAWKFHLLARSPRSAFVVPLELDADRECELPPTPGTGSLFEVLAPDGQRLWQTSFRHTKRVYEPLGFSAGISVDSDDQHLLVARPPRPTMVNVHVVSIAGNENVAGAVICMGPQDSFGSVSDVHDSHEIARTDAEGNARVPLYLHFDDNGKVTGMEPSLRIWAESRGELVMRGMNGMGVSHDMTTVEVTLARAGHAVRGRLLFDANTPASNVPVLVYQAGHFVSSKPWVSSTNEAGDFRVPGRLDHSEYRVTAIVPKDGDGFGEEVYLAYVARRRAPGGDTDLGHLRLDELERTDIEVVDESGSPASLAWIHLGESRDSIPATLPTWRTDRRGRTTLRHRRVEDLAPFVSDSTGFAFARFDDARADTKVLRLQLQYASILSARSRILVGSQSRAHLSPPTATDTRSGDAGTSRSLKQRVTHHRRWFTVASIRIEMGAFVCRFRSSVQQ